VRSDLVVAVDPSGGDVADFVQRIEQVCAEDFLAVGAVEAFDVGILIRLARLYESQLDILFLTPIGERLAGQLGAVVAANGAWPAVQVNHLGQEGGDASGRDTDGHIDAQGTAVGLVDHIQRPEHATAIKGVTHEVDGPDGIHPRFHQQRLSHSLRDAALGTTWEIESQLAVHPPDSFVIPPVALSP
jgi:hypothetical protein